MESTAAVDVLEITAVYGTQAVSIKKEDEPVVSVKEEATESDTEYGEHYSCNTNDRIHDLTVVPLVYTTRLDQMNAMRQIGKHTSKEVTEMILAESKPQYKHISVPIKSEPVSHFTTSYIDLCCQVQQLNIKVKTETFLRNEKLINICKPLKIVLEDFNMNKSIEPHYKILGYSDLEDYSPDEHLPLSHLSADMSATKPTPHKKKCKTKTVTMTIAIKDKRSQDADIYIIDSDKGVKNYYRTNIAECNEIQKLHHSKKAMLVEYCCWVNREKRINKLIQLCWTNASLSVFLRKPHNCLPRPCSCCCVFGTPMPKKSLNNDIYNIMNKETIIETIKPINIDNSLIEKAKHYLPNIFSAVNDKTLPVKLDNKSNHLRKAVIIMKYHRIIFTQTGLLGENYEIGDKGEIVSFVRPTVNRSITEEMQLYQMFDTISGMTRTYFSNMVCCWHCREDVIGQQLNDLLSTSTLLFLRTPHLCGNDKCECCCKPVPLIHLTLKNCTTKSTYSYKTQKKAKAPVVEENKSKKKINKKKKIGILNDNKNIQNLKKKSSKTKTNKKKSSAPQKTEKNIPKRVVHPFSKSALPVDRVMQNSAQDNIYLATDSGFKQNYIPSNSKTILPNTEFVGVPNQPNLGNSIVLSSENLADITTVRPTLANDILDKLKNLKLCVNDNGKLTAMIDTRPGKLSTVEITIISDILSVAESQIKQLGITPQEFSNRVNSSKQENNNLLNTSVLSSNIFKNKSIYDTHNDNSNFLTPSQVTSIDPQGFKAVPLNSLVPVTNNKSPVSSIYQIMSSLGGQKNQHLVEAYTSHFKEKLLCRNKPLAKNRQKNNMAVLTTLNVNSEPLHTRIPVMKRKMETKPTQKKLRVKSPEKLLPERYTIDTASILDKQKNTVPLLVSNSNLIPLQDTSGAAIPQTTNDAIKYNHTPFLIITQTQNTCGAIAAGTALGVGHNKTLDTSNNGSYSQNSNRIIDGIILTSENESEIIVPEPIEVHNQTQLLINDINIRSKENVNDTIALNTGMMADLAPYLSTSNFTPIQTSGADASSIVCAAKSSAESKINAKASGVIKTSPLLHEMLSSSLKPCIPQPRSNTISAKPLILSHSKGSFNKQKRKSIKNTEPSVLNKTVEFKQNTINTANEIIEINISSSDDEMEFGISLKNNSITLPKPDHYTDEEIQDAVNNKQMMMINNEEESIFGV